ncbi:hypothetical protein K466DRAFT_310956 [Polyporus arcularius HHB13444]|uniref:Uncharacterized protein n=1 Tax=Polyporus arcularius HHB13444 TaxID=1314778 RepID=A0A5C3P8P6_9APHY|nr:hypothetical protein K466DRAFT_310956 [Polyporus arcularius HHB13444]
MPGPCPDQSDLGSGPCLMSSGPNRSRSKTINTCRRSSKRGKFGLNARWGAQFR